MIRSIQYLIIAFLLIGFSTSLTAQWSRQYPLKKLENVLAIDVASDGFGFAVGDNDVLLRLNPSMQAWDLLLSWNKGWSLVAVDYLGGSGGATVAAGGQGLILSTNAGATWEEVVDAPSDILAIQMMSVTELLVVSDGSVELWDNGTWTDLGLPVSSGVSGAFILDQNHIWVYTLGSSPVIYYTSDGGDNWSMNTDIDGPDIVRFYNTQYGVATDGRKIYHSVDGGNSWTNISTNAIHNNSNDLAFGQSPNVLMSATNNGEPTITQDSGRTWTKFDMGTINTRNYAVAGVSDESFWVGNDITSITLTTDSGLNWIETSGPDRRIHNDIFFIDRNIGFTVGWQGTVLRSLDGGTHWEKMPFDPSRIGYCVFGLNENDVWLGANRGLFHSTDMGLTWEETLPLSSGLVNDVIAADANLVMAVTSTGNILRTVDGGANFDIVYQTNNQLRSIAQIDAQRFMVTGFNGLILKSTDRGVTWTIITPPELGLQYEQTQFIGEEGWMVTSSFKKDMWHTTNAGDTWSPILLPIERFWDGLYFITPDTGIVVGRTSAEGRVYITFNGGQNWQAGYITSYPVYSVTGLPNPNGTAWICGFGSNIEVLPYCNAQPVISDFAGETSPCENDTTLYTISGQDVSQYFWLFPSGWQIIGNSNNDSVWVRVGRNSGTVSVTGSNPCGISETINTSLSPFLLPTISNFSGNDSPCEGALESYSVNASQVEDFIWAFPADWTIISDPDQAFVMVEIGKLSGLISVYGTNLCGESALLTKMVATDPLPSISAITGELAPCQGTTVNYSVVTADAESVEWAFPADWNIISNPTLPDVLVEIGSEGGNISASGINDCGMVSTFIEVFPLSAPAVSIFTNENLLILSQTGDSYQWFLNGVIINGATASEYTATVTGAYSATVTYNNGCTATAAPVNVIISAIGRVENLIPISVYPVPTRETILLNGLQGEFDFTIFDHTGIIALQNSSAESTISVAALAEGAYILHVKQGDKNYQARFVIMR